MKFKIEPPTKSGYYWIVDKTYPLPFPVFFQAALGGGRYFKQRGPEMGEDSNHYIIRQNMRYGDEIIVPDCKTNVIE